MHSQCLPKTVGGANEREKERGKEGGGERYRGVGER